MQTLLSKVQSPATFNETDTSDAKELGITQEMEDTADSGRMQGASSSYIGGRNSIEQKKVVRIMESQKSRNAPVLAYRTE